MHDTTAQPVIDASAPSGYSLGVSGRGWVFTLLHYTCPCCGGTVSTRVNAFQWHGYPPPPEGVFQCPHCTQGASCPER